VSEGDDERSDGFGRGDDPGVFGPGDCSEVLEERSGFGWGHCVDVGRGEVVVAC
jgi:hypothetical protein